MLYIKACSVRLLHYISKIICSCWQIYFCFFKHDEIDLIKKQPTVNSISTATGYDKLSILIKKILKRSKVLFLCWISWNNYYWLIILLTKLILRSWHFFFLYILDEYCMLKTNPWKRSDEILLKSKFPLETKSSWNISALALVYQRTIFTIKKTKCGGS